MPLDKVDVEGLTRLRKALRKVEPALAKDLGQAGKSAADIVAQAAKPKVTNRTGKTARSVRAKVSYGGGAVVAGGAKVPWFGWLEFGGRRPGDNVTRQVVREGRWLYPTLNDKRPQVIREYAELVDEILRRVDLL